MDVTDPLFFYPPFGCSFGEAPLERKMEASHRAQALQKMRAYLEEARAWNSAQGLT